MEHVEGRVFKDALLQDLSREERKIVYQKMCEVLAKIHAVDIKAAGLQDYGKPRKEFFFTLSKILKIQKVEQLEYYGMFQTSTCDAISSGGRSSMKQVKQRKSRR